MPFRSKSQMRLLAAKKDRGEISEKTFHEFAEATPSISKLPEHAGGGVKRRKKRRRMAGSLPSEAK